ncbi:MAG: hypothetical protein LC789_10860 [Actinobacteria bacterium]|nr:hypothetical protein [Actinomycetota bacterium]MCA1721858.1 hypothetical protein [Actinomycetota bacterium]
MNVVGLLAVALVGIVLDLFTLLLLPFRIAGHLSPVGPVLALVANVLIGYGGNRLLQSRRPAQVLLALAIGVSLVAAGRGPGGDLFVTRDLQGLYLLYVVAAALGASVPLFFRATPGADSGREPSRGDGPGAP